MVSNHPLVARTWPREARSHPRHRYRSGALHLGGRPANRRCFAGLPADRMHRSGHLNPSRVTRIEATQACRRIATHFRFPMESQRWARRRLPRGGPVSRCPRLLHSGMNPNRKRISGRRSRTKRRRSFSRWSDRRLQFATCCLGFLNSVSRHSPFDFPIPSLARHRAGLAATNLVEIGSSTCSPTGSTGWAAATPGIAEAAPKLSLPCSPGLTTPREACCSGWDCCSRILSAGRSEASHSIGAAQSIGAVTEARLETGACPRWPWASPEEVDSAGSGPSEAADCSEAVARSGLGSSSVGSYSSARDSGSGGWPASAASDAGSDPDSSRPADRGPAAVSAGCSAACWDFDFPQGAGCRESEPHDPHRRRPCAGVARGSRRRLAFPGRPGCSGRPGAPTHRGRFVSQQPLRASSALDRSQQLAAAEYAAIGDRDFP
jgi:hypothetical protein